MNITKNKRLTKFINANMAFLAFCPVIMVVLQVVGQRTSFLTFAPIYLIVVIEFALREYCKHFAVFVLGNILMFAGIYPYLNNLIMLIAYIFIILVTVVANFILRVKPEEDVRVRPLPWQYLVIPAACEVGAKYLEYDNLHNPIIIISIVFMLLYFANKYLASYTDFLNEVRDIRAVPFKQIKLSTTILLAAFFAVVIVIQILSTFIPFGDYVKSFLLLIGNGLVFLLRLMFGNNKQEAGEEILEQPSQMTPDMSGLVGDAKTSVFWLILEKIIMYGTAILLAVAVVAGIVYGIYYIIRRFNESVRSENDVVEFLNPFDKAEKPDKVKKERSAILEFFAPTNEGRIRKIFYKAANTQVTGIGKNANTNKDYKTPAELLPSNDTLVKLYEKARYSNTPCTKEEVSMAKDSLK